MSLAQVENKTRSLTLKSAAGSNVFPPAQLPPPSPRPAWPHGETQGPRVPLGPPGSDLSRRWLAVEARAAGLPLTLPLPDRAPQLDFTQRQNPSSSLSP